MSRFFNQINLLKKRSSYSQLAKNLHAYDNGIIELKIVRELKNKVNSFTLCIIPNKFYKVFETAESSEKCPFCEHLYDLH